MNTVKFVEILIFDFTLVDTIKVMNEIPFVYLVLFFINHLTSIPSVLKYINKITLLLDFTILSIAQHVELDNYSINVAT